MAVSTSVVWELIDALLAKFRANTTIATNYNTEIVDGPPLTDLSRANILFVGAQPSDESGATPDASFTQAWGELGARARYEDVTVACELWVRDGSTDLSARRAAAKAILAAVESDLRTDFTLSIGRLMWCHITAAQFYQEQAKAPPGSTVSVAFEITGRARLASQ